MKRHLTSEYIGVDYDGEVLDAKCLAYLAEDDLQTRQNALGGIIKLWSFYGERRTDFKINTGKVALGGNEEFAYAVLLLEQWLTQVIKNVRRNLRPAFSQKSDVTPFIRGYVDFAAEAAKSAGIIQDIQSTFSELTFNHPSLCIIRDAAMRLSELKFISSGGSIASGIRRKIRQLLHTLEKVPPSKDPITTAKSVWKTRKSSGSGQVSFACLPGKLRPLAKSVEFACDVMLANSMSIGGFGVRLDGLALNMNYLLEYLLCEAMKAVGGEKSSAKFPTGRINKIRGSNGSWKAMSPDCFGVISGDTGDHDLNELFYGVTYILDSKHKNFFSHNSQVPSIERDDFLQLAAYSATHAGQDLEPKRSGLYGLVSLAVERDVRQNERYSYIDQNAIFWFDVEYSIAGMVVVKRMVSFPLKLVRFLIDFGSAGDDTQQKLCFRKLGHEILGSYAEKCLDDDALAESKGA